MQWVSCWGGREQGTGAAAVGVLFYMRGCSEATGSLGAQGLKARGFFHLLAAVAAVAVHLTL